MINHAGSQWSPLECDALALKFIPINLLQEEAELNDTKFWDYRFMHPTQATQFYAECYAAALKRAVSRRTDLWAGIMMKGLKKPVIFELASAAITGFWKGRQMADRIGCPYDFYCEHAMLFADKARMNFLPSSTKMYARTVPERQEGRLSQVDYIVERWVARTSHSTFYATDAAYTSDSYIEGQEQNRYLNFLFTKIRASSCPAGVLSTILEKGQITREQVLFAFPKTGADLFRRAVSLSQ